MARLIDTYRIAPDGSRELYAVNDCFASTEEAQAFYKSQTTGDFFRFVAQFRKG